MPVSSSIADEHGNGKGKGHTDHGNGKGKGHLKHQQDAMADGVYEMDIGGVNHVDHTVPGTTQTAPLADGSTFFTEVRQGSIQSTDQGLLFDTDNANGRLRAGVLFDADNRVTLGDLDTLSFDFTQVS